MGSPPQTDRMVGDQAGRIQGCLGNDPKEEVHKQECHDAFAQPIHDRSLTNVVKGQGQNALNNGYGGPFATGRSATAKAVAAGLESLVGNSGAP